MASPLGRTTRATRAPWPLLGLALRVLAGLKRGVAFHASLGQGALRFLDDARPRYFAGLITGTEPTSTQAPFTLMIHTPVGLPVRGSAPSTRNPTSSPDTILD